MAEEKKEIVKPDGKTLLKKVVRRRWTQKQIAEELIEFCKYIESEGLPTIYGFTAMRGFSRNRISEWLEFPELSGTVKKAIEEVQEICKSKFIHAILVGGILNRANPAVVIFALKNLAGWRDTPISIFPENGEFNFYAGTRSVDQTKTPAEVIGLLEREIQTIRELDATPDTPEIVQ